MSFGAGRYVNALSVSRSHFPVVALLCTPSRTLRTSPVDGSRNSICPSIPESGPIAGCQMCRISSTIRAIRCTPLSPVTIWSGAFLAMSRSWHGRRTNPSLRPDRPCRCRRRSAFLLGGRASEVADSADRALIAHRGRGSEHGHQAVERDHEHLVLDALDSPDTGDAQDRQRARTAPAPAAAQ